MTASTLSYEDYLTRVINDGIEAAKEDYKEQPHKARGSIAGFEACRGKSPQELLQVLADARKRTMEAYMGRIETEAYWEIRCAEAEIEWVCNCVSAMLWNQGLPTIVPPTARAVMKAAEILGVG